MADRSEDSLQDIVSDAVETVKDKYAPENIEKPTAARFLAWVGKFFGYVWVPEQHLQVIYYMTRYKGVREPGRFGFIKYSSMTETLGPQVFIGGQFKEYTFQAMDSRDLIPVTMRLKTLIAFDPRIAIPEVARVLTRRPRSIYGQIAETYLDWSLRSLVNRHSAVDLTQREILAQVETDLKKTATAEMEFLGIQVRGTPKILDVQLPTSLRERQEIIAQRRASILAGTEFHPSAFRQQMVTEIIERLGHENLGESFINFSDLLEAYAVEKHISAPKTVIIDQPPTKENPPPPSSGKRPRNRMGD